MLKTSLILGAAMITVFFLCSYRAGLAHHGGIDGTGAETGLDNRAGCTCHGTTATPQITLAIEIDSTGDIPVTTYKSGLTYIVKITGINTTNNNLPYFGFQITAITGATPQADPVNAGVWQQTGLPADVRYSPMTSDYLCNIIEHSNTLSPVSGTGGSGTVYTESITWVAPAAGKGAVSFWAALNAVTGIDAASASDKWDTQHVVLPETADDSISGVHEIAGDVVIDIYPNPSSGQFNVTSSKPMQSIEIYDITGRLIYTREMNSDKAMVNLEKQATGIYLIHLKSGNENSDKKVVISN
jgi:hypothetical protein